MAIVTRYFSTTSAGSRDGTTWADRASLFNSNVAVNSATWSGPFTPGETVTQTGTGATAVVELAGGSGAVLSLSSVAGTPNSSGVWTGGTSGATVTPTATPSANNWSMVIRNFDFSGSDSLECRIGPGTYTCAQQLNFTLFSNPPNTRTKPIFFHGADSNGDRIVPPNFIAAKSNLDDLSFPNIVTTNAVIISCSSSLFAFARCLRFESSLIGNPTVNLVGADYISVLNTSSWSTSLAMQVSGSANVVNSMIRCTGSAYYGVVSAGTNHPVFYNCRIIGASGTSGTRAGFTAGAFAGTGYVSNSYISSGGVGVLVDAQNRLDFYLINNCVINGCGGNGVQLNTEATAPTNSTRINNCMITNNGGYGVLCQAGSEVAIVSNCRLRNNTSGNFDNLGNMPDYDSIVASGTDADEFVDSANGDYRIKKTSTLWGKNLGAGDEPGGGGVPLIGTGGLVY